QLVGRPQDAIIVFREGDRDSLAVDLAAGEQNDTALMLGARLQNHLGTTDAGEQGTQRILEHVLAAYGGSQVEDAVGLSEQALHQTGVTNVPFQEAEARMALKRGQVLEAAGRQIVQR